MNTAVSITSDLYVFLKTQLEEEKEDENSTQYTLETTEEAQSSY